MEEGGYTPVTTLYRRCGLGWQSKVGTGTGSSQDAERAGGNRSAPCLGNVPWLTFHAFIRSNDHSLAIAVRSPRTILLLHRLPHAPPQPAGSLRFLEKTRGIDKCVQNCPTKGTVSD